jgi:ribosomal protein S18 acetylase RimI-like enzyme
MMNFTVRSATDADLETLNLFMYDLHQFHHQHVPDDFKTPEEVQLEKSIALYLESPDCLVLVAEFNGKVIGFVTGQFCELLSPISKSVLIGNIDELFVLKSYQKCSVATVLLQEMEIRFAEYGVAQIMVEVWDFNHAARGLYKKLGFEPHIHCLRKKISSNN